MGRQIWAARYRWFCDEVILWAGWCKWSAKQFWKTFSTRAASSLSTERVMEERTSRTRARSLDSSTTTPSGTPEEALSWTSNQILWELLGLRVLAKWTTVLHLSPSSSFFLSSFPTSSRTSPQQSPSFKAPAVEKLDEKNSLIGSTTRSLQRYQPHQGNSFLPLSSPSYQSLQPAICGQHVTKVRETKSAAKWPSSTTSQCSLLEAINNNSNNMIFIISNRAVFLMEVGYRGQHRPRQRLQSED